MVRARLRFLRRVILAAAVLLVCIPLAAADNPPTTTAYFGWAAALNRLIEQLVQTIFILALALPFLMPLLVRFARLEWRWVLWIWKRCFYPGLLLMVIALLAWALIAIPGPWRLGLTHFGVDPRYFEAQGIAVNHPAILGLVGGGRTPLAAQPLLLLGVLLPAPVLGAMVAWLAHLGIARFLAPRARAAAAVR